jgi:tetratricopeptide (TPR) repeat protein
VKYRSIIERFFSNELSEKERQSFLSDLEHNHEMKAEFDTYKEAYDFAITQENELNQEISELKDFDPKILKDIKEYGGSDSLSDDERQLLSILQKENLDLKKKNRLKDRNFKWLRAAVYIFIIAVTISAVFILTHHYTKEELFNQFFTPYEHSFNSRGFNENAVNTYNIGIILYDAGKYGSALKRFERFEDSLRISDEIYLLEGTCLIELGLYQDALKKLIKINESGLFYISSLWYQGLCYLKLNDDRNAKLTFKKINSAEPNYKKKAKKILKDLK